MNFWAKHICFGMRLIAVLVLLVAGFGLFQATAAGAIGVSLDLIDKLKISHDIPETPIVVEEKDDFEQDIYADVNQHNIDPIPETPIEVENAVPITRSDACSIKIRSGLSDPQPVFLETDAAAFFPYSNTGYLQVDSGKTIQMFCPDQFKSFAKTLITATCVSGSIFRVAGTTYKFSELICKSWPGYVIKNTGTACSGGVLLDVGFDVAPSRFVVQMQVCFNEQEEVTRYVHHTLNPGSNYYQTGVDRITFQTGGFFGGKNVNQLYTQKTQQQTINAALGGAGDQYFNSSKNAYLSRGHMAAKADMMYGSQQRATFLFINAAPQWQAFNSGNWARIEDGIRAWVSQNNINVKCYTGVYGVSTLPNHEGRETQLYLSRDANNNGLIPVPKLYFRVVIQPDTQKGIVFVGVNNPYITLDQIKNEYIICNDISDQVTYINWKKTSIAAGYSYACEVSDFLQTVKTLPDLTAHGGLLV